MRERTTLGNTGFLYRKAYLQIKTGIGGGEDAIIVVAHKEGFKDRDAFGLRSSIGRVLLTMGEEYPKLVISKLDYLQRSCSPEKPLAYYCRYYIESIQLSDLRKIDVPISMWEAKRIYECRHMG